MKSLGIDTSKSSSWVKCNSELRDLANTIKHGEGGSSKRLKVWRSDLFKESVFGQSVYEVETSTKDIELYINTLVKFWESFFSAALQTNE